MQKELAFVFPGQGSQKPGMLADLAAESTLVTDTFAEASEVLGYDLWALSQQGSQEELSQTERTQPLLLTASTAIWRLWCERGGPQPAQMAGHSLGEWSALVAAGALAFADGVRLVRERGRLMQEAVPAGQGAMAAIIGLDDAIIEKACQDVAQGEVVAPVNYNSPGQVVIAGQAAAVERAMSACQDAGAKRAMPLPVSAPFHTELMRPAAEKLAGQIEQTQFHQPSVPVVHNVTAAAETDPAQIRLRLVEQIYSPVRWVACVQAMAGQGAQVFAECGPGKVLVGLNRRIDKSLESLALEAPADLDKAIQRFA